MITKRLLRNITVLLLPYLIMVGINEYVRPQIKETPYTAFKVSAINSVIRTPAKCSWICHNDTNYCKTQHVKFLKSSAGFTDLLYFGAIGLLQATGNYGGANIIFLVTLFPLLMWFCLIKCIDYSIEIRTLKKSLK